MNSIRRVILILALIKITSTAPAVTTTATTIGTTTNIKQKSDASLGSDRFEKNYRQKTVEQKHSTTNSRQQNYVTTEKTKNSLRNEPNKLDGSHRQDKMLGYFGYYPQPFAPILPTPTAFYPQPNYYDDYGQIDEEEDIMSRANRRRPQNSVQASENSPIYYIRLPPTPYMFVPGYGYISQPPRITPMSTYAPMNHIAPMQSPVPSAAPLGLNPFINLPLDFLSNGKPTNIYQWGGNPMFQPNPYAQFGGGYPQRPTALPTYRPKTQYLPQESKVHRLKGQYLFNGRPDDIYVLGGNSYNSIYPEPMQNYY